MAQPLALATGLAGATGDEADQVGVRQAFAIYGVVETEGTAVFVFRAAVGRPATEDISFAA